MSTSKTKKLERVLYQYQSVWLPKQQHSSTFEEISENPGICFLALDPSESKLQLFHHPKVIGGSWKEPNKRMIAFIDFDWLINKQSILN